MPAKNFFRWINKWIHDYNLFTPDEDEYDDDNDQTTNPATLLKHQRYATRLYVPLVIGKH